VKRILLVGAGHAHLAVLRSLLKEPLRDARIGLVSPFARQVYSGMLPGVVAGHYRKQDAEIDVARLAASAQAEFIEGEVVGLDAQRRSATLKDGSELVFDCASLNAGSLADASVPGSLAHALPVKPFELLLQRLDLTRGGHIAVIGGGAGGVELAMAMRHRGAHVSVYSERSAFPPGLAPRVAAALRGESVSFLAMAVTRLEPGPSVIAGATEARYDQVVLASGAAPLPWLARCGLATDERGFVLVDETLRSVSHPEVFAAGDCATLREHPVPKSGVYALRQGQALVQSLRRLVAGQPALAYRPQRHALMLLSCGRRYAIAQRGGWSAEGRWVWWWKDRVDRSWVKSLTV
jgi:pyridine nucleotide-disulfide oxidoreductase family protein